MKRQEWKEKAAEMSGVPKDVAMGLPILTITGTNDLCVENYRGMTEYTDQIIRLQSKSGQIKITGKKLEVIYNRNLLGGLYRENPVKSRNYEAVKSSKKWENVGNSYIIPALLLYRYSYI